MDPVSAAQLVGKRQPFTAGRRNDDTISPADVAPEEPIDTAELDLTDRSLTIGHGEDTDAEPESDDDGTA